MNVNPGKFARSADALASVSPRVIVATVAGNFKLNTLTAAVAVVLNFVYVAVCLARHRRQPAISFDAAVKQ